MTDQTLFSDQAKRRFDAEKGQKIVYEGDPTPTLPDGRHDGSGQYSFEALRARSGLTRREKALLMLYRNPEGHEPRLLRGLRLDATGGPHSRAAGCPRRAANSGPHKASERPGRQRDDRERILHSSAND